MMYAPPPITIKGLHLRYPDGTVVFNSLDLEIQSSQFVAIVGRSGSGKSTLLKMISNLIRPTSGTVMVGTESAEKARISGTFSYCFQDPTLFGWRTCIENVALPSEISSRFRGDPAAALRLVGLEGAAKSYPHELSGGMRQRVALARALSYEAPIMILDEPFSALDEVNRMDLNHQLARIWNTLRFTCIFTSHSVMEAVALADRVLVLSANRTGLHADFPVLLPRPRGEDVLESTEGLHLIRSIRESLLA